MVHTFDAPLFPLSLSIWAEANFPAGYGHARLIADLSVLFFRSKSIRNKQLPKFYLRKKRQLEKFVTFLKWKSFSYYTSWDLTSILVLSYLSRVVVLQKLDIYVTVYICTLSYCIFVWIKIYNRVESTSSRRVKKTGLKFLDFFGLQNSAWIIFRVLVQEQARSNSGWWTRKLCVCQIL